MEKGDTSDFGTDSNSGQRAADADKTADEQTDSHTDEHHTTAQDGRFPVSRRATLASVATLAGLGLLSDSAQAQQGPPVPGPKWNRDVDADGNGLFNLGSLTMSDNPTAISDFEGANLSIDAGVLNATDTRTNVSDDGSQVVAGTTDINFGSNLAVSDDGDGSVTVDASSSLWADTDSDLLLEASGFDGIDVDRVRANTLVETPQIGTRTNTPFEAVVNAERALRIEPTSPDYGANLIGGHPSNSVASGVEGATISGGGFDDGATSAPNTVSNDFGTVGGGLNNTASGFRSTVGGGTLHVASGNDSTIGGGGNHTASGPVATIAGGGNNTASGTYATVSGGHDHTASALNATIGGGSTNTASDEQATVGGGRLNVASGYDSTVSGGGNNTASGVNATIAGGNTNAVSETNATIGGGSLNAASGSAATVGGGTSNTASGDVATVGGGTSNTASGLLSTVPGGTGNSASGEYAFAAGRGAQTQTATGTPHDGAVVFGDSSPTTVRSQRDNQFVVQAGGGARVYSSSDLSTGVDLPPGGGSWSSLSSRAAKTNIQSVDPEAVLDAVDSLELSTWEYDSEEDAVHMGPMAEEFYDAFALGDSERRISTVDADGVALAAIQGLSAKLDKKDGRIDELEQANEALREQCDTLEERLTALEAQAT